MIFNASDVIRGARYSLNKVVTVPALLPAVCCLKKHALKTETLTHLPFIHYMYAYILVRLYGRKKISCTHSIYLFFGIRLTDKLQAILS